MPLRTRAVLVTLAAGALLVAGCEHSASRTTAPSGAASTPAATFSAPPLRLPVVAPGAPCPTAKPQAWSGPGQASAVLGPGPLYPVADYFASGTVLELHSDRREPGGSYEVKVRWLDAGYVGPVLLRAGRIDGAGTASANFLYVGSSRDGGYSTQLTAAAADLPGSTAVSGPGCYAYQVDGTTFSRTIVFRAVKVD